MQAASFVVTGEGVNLRSAPEAAAEVVGQVSKGQILVSVELEGDWLGVKPPEEIDLWVYGELLIDGRVAVPKLQVRAGPGINYQAVGSLTKGDKVIVRGSHADWVKIAPPDGSVIWISREYVEAADRSPAPAQPAVRADPPKPAPKPAPSRPQPVRAAPPRRISPVAAPEARPSRTVKPATPSVPVAPEPAAPQQEAVPGDMRIRRDLLVARTDQGQPVTLRGTVRKAAWVWRRPSQYCLVDYRERGRPMTRCYLVAKEAVLAQLEGVEVEVAGREYLIQGVKLPAVIVETVTDVPASDASR